MEIKEDMHVHSTYSDGVDTIESNLKRAEMLGLERLCCVDHVRADTDWVAKFAAHVDELRKTTNVELCSGVETKILNTSGDLDLPPDIEGIDYIYVADHQFPTPAGPRHPREIAKLIAAGTLSKEGAVGMLAEATVNALKKHRPVVIAHLFSILPKISLDESEVERDVIMRIARVARKTAAKVEVDERWKCPSLRTVRIFRDEGVEVVFSSDSHRSSTIGFYNYNLEVLAGL